MPPRCSVPVLLLAAAAGACASPPPPARPAAAGPNVLLIVIDTLRWDHVGCYGAERETTPALDRLAAAGVRFERAFSTAPWTMPSVASMLTGQYPSRHSATRFDRALPEEIDTLAEVLGRQGWATAGVISHTAIAAKHGFAQGFDVWEESEARGHDHVSTEGVTRQALEQLERLAAGAAPFFLFVHYFDPHYNYKRHADIGFAPAQAGRLDGTELMRAIRDMQETLTPEELDFVTALYDEEIRHTDGGIGLLLERLDRLGLAQETLIVLTADHGEEFLDHGRLGHTRTLYDELVRVPLIVRLPGAAPGGGAVVEQPVSLVAVMPTILDVAGARPQELPMQGESLRPFLEGGAPADAPRVFTEVDFVPVRVTRTLPPVHKKAVVVEGHKLVRNDETGKVELYDLAADPREQKDLSATEPALLTRLVAELGEALELAASGALAPESVTYDEEEIKALKSLGYVGD